jgi:hypothetical protein
MTGCDVGAAKRVANERDSLMPRVILRAAIALSLMAPVATADAGSGQKHHRQHKQKTSTKPVAQPNVFPWAAPVDSPRRGPPWAMPNECYNDEGYGRWSPCFSRYD